MKQLKSSVGDLRDLFARTVTLRDIAEPLVSFDQERPVAAVRAFMEQREFDVVGIRTRGIVSGYVVRGDLENGELSGAQRSFTAEEVLPDSEPLLAAFAALRERRHVFIRIFGQVGGIVTRGDLQKAPVRLWLFGLVSLLEMQLQRLVRERHPDAAWRPLLTAARVSATQQVFADRQRRREETDLLDCLQLGDKATIFMKDAELFRASGFASKQALENFFKQLGLLRNALAHANDIASGRWPALVALVTTLESFLERLETVSFTPRR
jgi:hypothetical protein